MDPYLPASAYISVCSSLWRGLCPASLPAVSGNTQHGRRITGVHPMSDFCVLIHSHPPLSLLFTDSALVSSLFLCVCLSDLFGFHACFCQPSSLVCRHEKSRFSLKFFGFIPQEERVQCFKCQRATSYSPERRNASAF